MPGTLAACWGPCPKALQLSSSNSATASLIERICDLLRRRASASKPVQPRLLHVRGRRRIDRTRPGAFLSEPIQNDGAAHRRRGRNGDVDVRRVNAPELQEEAPSGIDDDALPVRQPTVDEPFVAHLVR